MRFDLTDLKLFRDVVDTGSITAGAQRSHLALASASARLRGMENLLGVPLLLRQRRGVTATPAGLTLLAHARLMLRQMENLRGDLGAYAAGLRGQIRLLCNTSAMTEFLPQALGGFMKTHARIALDIEELQSREIVSLLQKGEADIGIVADTVDAGGLQSFPFRDDRLVLVAAPDHALARAAGRKRSLAFADSLEHEFVGLAGHSALQDYLSGQAEQAGLRLRYRIRLRSFDGICQMVRNGAGIAIVPATAARRYGGPMHLRRFDLKDRWAMRRLLICMRVFDDLPAHAQALVHALRMDAG